MVVFNYALVSGLPDMQHITGVEEVTIRKFRNILSVTEEPDVFASPASNTFVVFGEAKVPIKLIIN